MRENGEGERVDGRGGRGKGEWKNEGGEWRKEMVPGFSKTRHQKSNHAKRIIQRNLIVLCLTNSRPETHFISYHIISYQTEAEE